MQHPSRHRSSSTMTRPRADPLPLRGTQFPIVATPYELRTPTRRRVRHAHGYALDMVNLTRIYTRTGDGGETRLGDMSKTSKTDPRLEAYATTDEANAHIGVALAAGG